MNAKAPYGAFCGSIQKLTRSSVLDMHLDHPVITVQIFMSFEFSAGEIMEDEFLGGQVLLRVDFDEHDEIARKDLAVGSKLAEEFPVRIKPVGAGTQGELGLMADFRLQVVHTNLGEIRKVGGKKERLKRIDR